MKITLDIPDGMRCICISGVREKDGELLLISSTVGSDNLYDGAKFKVLWEKRMKRKRFIKLLMGKFLLSRNEANYIADVARILRICDWREPWEKV